MRDEVGLMTGIGRMGSRGLTSGRTRANSAPVSGSGLELDGSSPTAAGFG